MPTTPRTRLPYPAEQKDPWFDQFLDFVLALDAGLYAEFESRNILMMGGGTISWDAGTGTLSWSDNWEFSSAPVGFLWRVVAASLVVADGGFIYFQAVRSPTNNVNVVLKTGSKAPAVVGEDAANTVVVGLRRGSVVYLRNGMVLQDGGSLSLAAQGTSIGSVGQKIVRAFDLALGLTTDSAVMVEGGGRTFNPGDHDLSGTTKTVYFQADAYVDGGGLTGEVELYNLTTATVEQTLTFNGTTVPTHQEAAIVLANPSDIYQVRYRVLGGVPGVDYIHLLSASLKVVNTVN